MAVTDTVEDFQFGRVFSRTFGLVSRNAGIFLVAAAIVMLPLLLVSFYLGSPNYMVTGTTKGWMFGVLSFVMAFICPSLLQAALVQAAITDLNGNRPSLGQSLSTGFALFLPVVGITIAWLAGFLLGSILLVVPGLIVMAAWSVVIPVRVIERTGFTATFGRSRALTKGYRWQIFGLLVLYWAAIVALSLLVTMASGLGFLEVGTVSGNVPYIILQWVQSVVVSLIGSVGVTAIYYELRTVKEGIAPESLAAAFD
jgi:hypothetical protein